MQVCTSLQTDNHASTPPLCFLQAGCPSCRPTNSVKALKALAEICDNKRNMRQSHIRIKPTRLVYSTDLSTLDLGNEALVLQLQPVSLVQLRPNQEVQVTDLVVFTNQRRCEAKLCVCLDGRQHATKHLRRNVLYLCSSTAHTMTKQGKGSPYSIAERRVPQLILVLSSQPAGDVSHKPSGRLPLLSTRPAVTLATLKKAY